MKSFLWNDFASVPGEETITPIPDPSVPIGQTDKMSKIDIERINKLYKCSEYKRHERDNPLCFLKCIMKCISHSSCIFSLTEWKIFLQKQV